MRLLISKASYILLYRDSKKAKLKFRETFRHLFKTWKKVVEQTYVQTFSFLVKKFAWRKNSIWNNQIFGKTMLIFFI